MNIDHSTHEHEATTAARTACREGHEHGPFLGLATTRKLLEELLIRGEVSALMYERGGDGDLLHDLSRVLLKCLSPNTLDYRTVDDR
jgi:hypothetical protein